MRSVYLAAGHSEKDPGAVAFGRREADIAVEFRNYVLFYIDRFNDQQRAAGQPAIRIGTDGVGMENMPLTVAAAQARGFDIALEFHCNASTSPSARGAEVLSSPKDSVLAAKVSAAIAKALDTRDRGAKPENAGQHHRLAFVRSGGMVVELFFLTSMTDLLAYDAKKWVAARDVAAVVIEAARGA